MTTAINAIYRGSVTYTSGSGTTPTAINLGGTIVTANSIVSMTIRSNDAATRARRHYWTYDLTTTTIAFTRNESSSATTLTIEWEVIEFDTGVTVQRGNETFGTSSATHDITITSVTTGQAFSTIVGMTTTFSAIPYKYVDITSATNIRVTADGVLSGTNIDSWQVIEFDSDVDVQRGLSTSSGGTSKTSRTQSITSIDLSRSFAVHCGMTPPSGTTGRPTQSLGFNSATELQITSLNFGTTNENTTSWAAIELPSGSTVESGSVSVTNTNTTPTTQPNWTTALSNGSLLYGAYQTNVRKITAADSNPNSFMFAISLDSPEDSLTVQRDGTALEFTLEWFAIDWPVAVVGGFKPYFAYQTNRII